VASGVFVIGKRILIDLGTIKASKGERVIRSNQSSIKKKRRNPERACPIEMWLEQRLPVHDDSDYQRVSIKTTLLTKKERKEQKIAPETPPRELLLKLKHFRLGLKRKKRHLPLFTQDERTKKES